VFRKRLFHCDLSKEDRQPEYDRPTAFRLGPGNVRCFQPSRSLRPRNKSRSLILIPALRVKSGTGKQTTAPSKSFLASSDDGVLERHALGIVFSKPFLGGLLVGNDLQMVDCRRHPCWCRRKSKLFSPHDPVGFRAFPARFRRGSGVSGVPYRAPYELQWAHASTHSPQLSRSPGGMLARLLR
jgi:hypothetical protein